MLNNIKEGFKIFRFLLFLHGNMFSAFPVQSFRISTNEGEVTGDYFIPFEETHKTYTKAFWEVLETDYKDLIK